MKKAEIERFDARHVENDIIKRFAILWTFFAFFHDKMVKNAFLFTNGLITYYL